MERLAIDVWSDIACPWCYVGKRRLEAALAQFEGRDRVDLRWRAFELDPNAPRVLPPSPPYVERLARKYRVQVEEAQAMMDRMTETAAADGLVFRFDRVQPGNTFDAHRLLAFAFEAGKQDELKEALFRAYLTEGRAIGETATLQGVADEVGLDSAETERVLSSDAFAMEVRSEEAAARTLNIHGVPFFVLGQKLGVSGAQTPDVLLDALRQAQATQPEGEKPGAAENAAACSPDECAV